MCPQDLPGERSDVFIWQGQANVRPHMLARYAMGSDMGYYPPVCVGCLRVDKDNAKWFALRPINMEAFRKYLKL
jgi:hypothetical protein